MKIKDLRKLLKGLPANMEVMIDTGLRLGDDLAGYDSLATITTKARVKLVRNIGGYSRVQSRPHKDAKAKLYLIIE